MVAVDDVSDWHRSDNPSCGRWRAVAAVLRRRLRWKMAVERTIFFAPGEAEQSSVFSSEKAFEMAVRENLPATLKDLPLRVDTARHVHRPARMRRPPDRIFFSIRSAANP